VEEEEGMVVLYGKQYGIHRRTVQKMPSCMGMGMGTGTR
jgi:hypothetical protein